MNSVRCRVEVTLRPSFSPKLDHHFKSSSITFKPFLKETPIFHGVSTTIKQASVRLLDALVHSLFQFIDQPLLPSQSNFGPVEQIAEAVDVTASVYGRIPHDFPTGVYIRNGPNPLFGGLKSTKSIFGKSSQAWVEGEGMLHALYLFKDNDGKWMISYNNRHVETESFTQEKARKKPAFLPAIEGDSTAVVSAYLFNLLRFGIVNKTMSNTSIFEHSGKLYSISEGHLPQEIDFLTLETGRDWDVNGAWNRPFTSHPHKAPDSGELVTIGVEPVKPYLELGVISADGEKLLHKVDLKLDRCCLCHEIGITERYNVIPDFPLTIDINRLISGGPLLKYNKEEYARIGVMPRYGNADSVQWFQVQPCSMFHIINCYEQGDEVVVMACRAPHSIIPGPDFGSNKFEWFSAGFKRKNCEETEDEVSFFSRVYEWRLDMATGEVVETNLTGTDYSMEFPIINGKYVGRRNEFAYTQVVDSESSSISGMAKYGGLAKLHLQEKEGTQESVRLEYHMFPKNSFCTGAAFVAKEGGREEDDGWIITYVHDEDNNTSHVYDTWLMPRIYPRSLLPRFIFPLECLTAFMDLFCLSNNLIHDGAFRTTAGLECLLLSL